MKYLDTLGLKNTCENNGFFFKAVHKPVMYIATVTQTKNPLSSLQRNGKKK